jgi:hypothetical protein
MWKQQQQQLPRPSSSLVHTPVCLTHLSAELEAP